MNPLSGKLAALINRRRQITALQTKLTALRTAEAGLEREILTALQAGQAVRWGSKQATLGTEQRKADPSLRFLIGQLGEERAQAVWAALEVREKPVVVVDEVEAQAEAAA